MSHKTLLDCDQNEIEYIEHISDNCHGYNTHMYMYPIHML